MQKKNVLNNPKLERVLISTNAYKPNPTSIEKKHN